LIAVYEAGPTGFGLARAGLERGLDIRVAAPGLIPRAPSDRVKTDRRDAERLARLLAAGELRFVHVPTVPQERFRDLLRCREDLRGDLMRSRHRLSKFLMRHGLRYEGPGHNWTESHRKWLGRLTFDDRATHATFVDYLSALDGLGQRRTALDETVVEVVPEPRRADAGQSPTRRPFTAARLTNDAPYQRSGAPH
jgi:transposase